MRHQSASVPTIKALFEVFPAIIVRHARRLSKALGEYSMAELNTLVNPMGNFSEDGAVHLI
jgi:hypothetical protein